MVLLIFIFISARCPLQKENCHESNGPEARVHAYAAAVNRLAEDFKAISLFSDNYIIVSKSTVSGIVTAFDERVWFNDVVKK